MIDLDLKAMPEVEAVVAVVPAAEATLSPNDAVARTADGASPPADRLPGRVPWQWSDEREAELRRLHDEGRGPTEIARLMGITKSAACGKLARLGLAVRRLACWAPPKPRVRVRVRSVAGTRPRAARPKPIQPRIPGKVTIWELTERSCRWPLFEGGEPVDAQFYCGTEAVRGMPYCGPHCAKAWSGRL